MYTPDRGKTQDREKKLDDCESSRSGERTEQETASPQGLREQTGMKPQRLVGEQPQPAQRPPRQSSNMGAVCAS
ncbi:hypothetical protein BV22DRAFT_1038148 [Leucogyrophana mollusca]|uniref:Uncharacterized protein n=1 Tax=Leucogyrophana mollusca TaxID=85980 RepID=A0ACB8B7U3_9AGAM|nr:hypothetical protein BV22DRAFT_1038148 [Leucogyrophana mollusca]